MFMVALFLIAKHFENNHIFQLTMEYEGKEKEIQQSCDLSCDGAVCQTMCVKCHCAVHGTTG